MANEIENTNFLSPLGFRLSLTRAPALNYFCQTATVPSVSINEAPYTNPLVTLPYPGDKVSFEPLNVRFKVDEDFQNYLEIFNWLMAIGHPETLDQYPTNDDDIFSRATLLVLTSNNNQNILIVFHNLFPISLGSLDFDTTQASIEYMDCDASFRYSHFTIET
jgi:hypothetical protein